jgi:hypothetical protein
VSKERDWQMANTCYSNKSRPTTQEFKCDEDVSQAKKYGQQEPKYAASKRNQEL